jgi:hypothetical protein
LLRDRLRTLVFDLNRSGRRLHVGVRRIDVEDL